METWYNTREWSRWLNSGDLEEGESNWSAYVPGLPGCVAAAATREETEALIREAMELHLDLMRADGEELAPARS